MRAHQYLYYVECIPIISDYEYDKFCKDNGLHGGGGSDRASDYTDEERDYAKKLLNEFRLKKLNRENGVIEGIEELRGWHLVEATLYKRGVYRIVVSRHTGGGAELRHGFVSQHMLATARELGYLSAPNGYTLP
jgi:hypothetical protein